MTDFFQIHNIDMNHQTTFTIVQLIDEFLDSFNITEVANAAAVTDSEIFINTGIQLGAGGLGTAYENPIFPDVVIKRQAICYDSSTNLKKELCKLSVDGSLIFNIPNTILNKTSIFCPNYISENLIGILLNRTLSRYTPSFPKIYNFAIDIPDAVNNNIPNDPSIYNTLVYTSMEKLNEINPLITDFKTFFYMLFQVCQGLSVSQKLLKFTHYDLHLNGNVLAKVLPHFKINIYELDNGQYFYTRGNFDSIISDFGFSRIETPNHIITPTSAVSNEKFKFQEPGFNPYYDLISFFYYAFNSAFRTEKFTPLSNFDSSKTAMEQSNYRGMLILFVKIFKKLLNISSTMTYQQLNDFIKGTYTPDPNKPTEKVYTNMHGYWRFRVEKLNQLPFKMSTPTEMMTKLALLSREALYLDQFNKIKTPENIVQYLEANTFLLLDNLVKIPNGVYNGVTTECQIYPKVNSTDKQDLTFYKYKIFDDTQIQIENGITAVYYSGLNQNDIVDTFLPDTHFTPTKSMIIAPVNLGRVTTFLDQSITVVQIDQNLVENGYKYRFDCCKIDPRNYFQNSSIKSGVLINSTFFHLFKKTDTPIGYTRSQGIIFDDPIPELFKPYYGGIGVDENGKLKILETLDQAEEYQSNVLTVGPLLVYTNDNGVTENRFSRVMMETERDINGQFLFKSGKIIRNFTDIFSRWEEANNNFIIQNNQMVIKATPGSTTQVSLSNGNILTPIPAGKLSFSYVYNTNFLYPANGASYYLNKMLYDLNLPNGGNVNINIPVGSNFGFQLISNDGYDRELIISNWSFIPDEVKFAAKPGELYHAGNPNPRSAIAITGDDVYFIKVEGRDARTAQGKPGVGMDLAQLAEYCINVLNADFAINLDGGGSSQIVWKEENTNYITLSGGMDIAYPVGSVIAFVKEK